MLERAWSGREPPGGGTDAFEHPSTDQPAVSTASATPQTASRLTAGSRTTPPEPTRSRPTSNCGFTIISASNLVAAQARTAGRILASEMNETSTTTTSGSNGRLSASSDLAFVRSMTVTRGSVRSDQSSSP